nr:hypothetical protein [Bradyrhizobium sp. 139]
MVVPLREHRHLRVEGAEVLIEMVVFVVAAELRSVRDLGFFLLDFAPTVLRRADDGFEPG